MNQKLNLIPFDYEKWKAGAKAVYRDGTIPRRVEPIPESVEASHAILSVTAGGFAIWHYENGTQTQSQGTCYDLYLQVETKRRPLTNEEWIALGPWWIRLKGDSTLEAPVKIFIDGSLRIIDKTIVCFSEIMENYERTNGTLDQSGKLVWEPCWRES